MTNQPVRYEKRVRELNLHHLSSVDVVLVSLRKTDGERATIVGRISMNARLALNVDTSLPHCFPVHRRVSGIPWDHVWAHLDLNVEKTG